MKPTRGLARLKRLSAPSKNVRGFRSRAFGRNTTFEGRESTPSADRVRRNLGCFEPPETTMKIRPRRLTIGSVSKAER